MTTKGNEGRANKVIRPGFKTIEAHWEVPFEGPDGPKRDRLIDLAFRLAAAVRLGFAPSRTRRTISSRFEDGEMEGGTAQEDVYRLGDTERGVEITEHIYNPNDGIVGISSWVGIKVFGLPEGWEIYLDGDFVAAQYGRPQPMSLKATLPEDMINTVAKIIKAEVGATVEEN